MTAQSHFIRAVDPRQPALRPATCRSRWRPSRSRSFLLCTISLLGASIAALPSRRPAPRRPKGLVSADGEQAGTRAVVTDLKRAGNTVTLKFVIYNDSGADLATNAKFTDDGYNGWLSFSGVHLLDGPGKKKYFAVKDGDGNCVCSDGVNGIKAKTSMTFWVKYPAPPDSTQKITVDSALRADR